MLEFYSYVQQGRIFFPIGIHPNDFSSELTEHHGGGMYSSTHPHMHPFIKQALRTCHIPQAVLAFRL